MTPAPKPTPRGKYNGWIELFVVAGTLAAAADGSLSGFEEALDDFVLGFLESFARVVGPAKDKHVWVPKDPSMWHWDYKLVLVLVVSEERRFIRRVSCPENPGRDAWELTPWGRRYITIEQRKRK